jgi:hypothetical protein
MCIRAVDDDVSIAQHVPIGLIATALLGDDGARLFCTFRDCGYSDV